MSVLEASAVETHTRSVSAGAWIPAQSCVEGKGSLAFESLQDRAGIGGRDWEENNCQEGNLHLVFSLDLLLVAKSCLILATLWTVAHQALLSMDSQARTTGVGCRFLLQGSSQLRDQSCISCFSCISCRRTLLCHLGRESPRSYDTSTFYVLKNPILFSIVAVSIYSPTNMRFAQGFSFLRVFTSIRCLLSFLGLGSLWNLSSLIRNQTHAPCSGSKDLWLLDHQKICFLSFLIIAILTSVRCYLIMVLIYIPW